MMRAFCQPLTRLLPALAALSLCTATLASGFVIVVPDGPHPPRHHPHPQPPGHVHRHQPLVLKHHRVDTAIREQVATTEVEQVFLNTARHRIEGTYLFPIPEGAQIDRFTMYINGTETEAELLPADKARQIYEDIVRRIKDPALLEYAGQGLVKVRVFPIEPNEEKRLTLKYTEVLRSDSGLVAYRQSLPAMHTHNSGGTLSVRTEITSRHPIKSVYSPTHEIDITRPAGNDNRVVVGFEASPGTGAHPAGDFQLFYSVEPSNESDIGLDLMTFRKPGSADDGYFLLLLSPAAHLSDEQVVEKDVVFVLDTSGSMGGRKIVQAKNALQFCIESLNEGDRFEVIHFATDVTPLFRSFVPNTDENRAKASEFVDALRARGGTAIDDALRQALAHMNTRADQDRPYVIIFLTDGQPTVGVTRDDDIVANLAKAMSEKSVRIFNFGIGHDVNTYLLDRIALQTRAASQYVLPDENIEVKVSNFYARINDPVLSDVKLSFGDNIRISRMYPAPLPDLFMGDQLVLFGRYSGTGQAAITLQGTVNRESRTYTYEAAFADEATDHEFIPRLWATRRIGFLLDQIRLLAGGESKELKDEIAQLARDYGIVTPFTSWLILEDEATRNVPLARRTLQHLEGVQRSRQVGAPPPQRTAPAPERQVAAESYDHLRMHRSGSGAVSAAQSNAEMRGAYNLNQIAAANVYGDRIVAGGQMNQQARMVRGRAFHQNGDLWVDANIQAAPQDARRVQVAFDSDEYYELLRTHPEAAPWLAVGRNVQLLLDDVIYEIIEEDPT